MKIRYRTSVEKWESLEKVAREVLKAEKLAKMCKDIAEYIKKKGDRSLEQYVEVEINSFNDFEDVIYHSEETPCPHCLHHFTECDECELDSNEGCCGGLWHKVFQYIYEFEEETE